MRAIVSAFSRVYLTQRHSIGVVSMVLVILVSINGSYLSVLNQGNDGLGVFSRLLDLVRRS